MARWGGRHAAVRGDDGSAVVEFIFLAVVLMIPVVYLVLTLARVQEAAFAAEAVARDVSRAAVVGGVDALQHGSTYSQAQGAGRDRANAALATTLSDFHLDASDAVVDLECSADPCLTPGSDITVAVSIEVSLPGIGTLLPRARISVHSTGSSPVDGYLP